MNELEHLSTNQLLLLGINLVIYVLENSICSINLKKTTQASFEPTKYKCK